MPTQPRRFEPIADSFRPAPVPLPGRRTNVSSLISHFEERSRNPELFIRQHRYRHASPLPTPNTVRTLVDCFNRLVKIFSIRTAVASHLGSTTPSSSTNSTRQPELQPHNNSEKASSLRRAGQETEEWEQKNSQIMSEERGQRWSESWKKSDELGFTEPVEEITVSCGDNREATYRPHTNFNSVRVWKGQRDDYSGVERNTADRSIWGEPQRWMTPKTSCVSSSGQVSVNELKAALLSEGRGSRASRRSGSPRSFLSAPSSTQPIFQHSQWQHPGQYTSIGQTLERLKKDARPSCSLSLSQASWKYKSLRGPLFSNFDKQMSGSKLIPRVVPTPSPHPTPSSMTYLPDQLESGKSIGVSGIRERFEKLEREALPYRTSGSWRTPGVDLVTDRVATTGESRDNTASPAAVMHRRTNLHRAASEGQLSRFKRDRHRNSSPNMPAGSVSVGVVPRLSASRSPTEPSRMKRQHQIPERKDCVEVLIPGSFPSIASRMSSFQTVETKIQNCLGAPDELGSFQRRINNSEPSLVGGNGIRHRTRSSWSHRPRTFMDIALERRYGRKPADTFAPADTNISVLGERRMSSPLQYNRPCNSSPLSSTQDPSAADIYHNHTVLRSIRRHQIDLSPSHQKPFILSPAIEGLPNRTPTERDIRGRQRLVDSPLRSPSLIVEMGFPPLRHRATAPVLKSKPSGSKGYGTPRMRILPDNVWFHGDGTTDMDDDRRDDISYSPVDRQSTSSAAATVGPCREADLDSSYSHWASKSKVFSPFLLDGLSSNCRHLGSYFSPATPVVAESEYQYEYAYVSSSAPSHDGERGSVKMRLRRIKEISASKEQKRKQEDAKRGFH